MNEIVIDGKKYKLTPVEEEQLNVEAEPKVEKNPYERSKYHDKYYLIAESFAVSTLDETYTPYDNNRYKSGNYVTTGEEAKILAIKAKFWFKANQFSMLNGGIEIRGKQVSRWFICFGNTVNNISVWALPSSVKCSAPLFATKKAAEQFVEENRELCEEYFKYA